jgi:hypothetical protein
LKNIALNWQTVFKKPRDQGGILNSYDALKLIALVTMVIDHLGLYIWPDMGILRVIGRMAFPLFLFLVGYSANYKVRNDLIVYALLIIIFAALTHHHIFPLNILATIIVTRMGMPVILKHPLTTGYLVALFMGLTPEIH